MQASKDDLGGYSIVAKMLREGYFTLPLRDAQ